MKHYFILLIVLLAWGMQADEKQPDTYTGSNSFAAQNPMDSDYCDIGYSGVTYFLMEVSTNGGIDNLFYQTEAHPDGGYADLTSGQSLQTVPGATIDLLTLFQGVGNTVKVWIDWDEDAEFSEDEKVYDFYNIDPAKEIELNIPETVSAGDYRMRIASFYGESDDGPCGSYSDGSALDFNIEIVEPACYPANEIQFTITDDMNLQVSWTGNEEVTEWTVEYGDMTFEPGEGTQVTVSDTEFILVNPTIDFSYKFLITASCAADDSPTITTSYFYGYCQPRYTTSFFYLTDIETEGAEENLDYHTDQQPRDGYENLSQTQSVVTNPGDSFTLTTDYFAGGNALKIWVDWNKNLVFDDSEILYDEHSMMGDHTVTITIPEDAAPGTYRLRVASRDNQPIEACGLYSYGSTIDFSLIIPGAECFAPTDITVENIGETSADVSWTPGGEESVWAVIYGEEGFSLSDEFEMLTVYEPNAQLTDLEADTFYDIYVWAVCDPVNTINSDMVGPETFTTDKDMSVDGHKEMFFNFYPNPVENQVFVQSKNLVEQVVVYDLNGREVLVQNPVSVEFSVDMQGLSGGIYFMEIQSKEDSKTVRIIKK